MSAKAGKRPLRSLTPQEKLSAINRVHNGESKASVARDIMVPESTLRGWCKNQEKIKYMSSQSSPETDDSMENHQYKKMKICESDASMQPFNLSLKINVSGASTSTYSPNSDHHSSNELPSAPLNLRTKPLETSSPFTAITSTPKTAVNTSVTTSYTEKEREIKKETTQSAQSDVFLNSLSSANNLHNITGLLLQYHNMCQQQMYNNTKYAQKPPSSKSNVITPADTTSANMSASIPSSKGLLTTVDKEKSMLPNHEQQSVNDSVTYWLQQNMLNNLKMAQNMGTSSSTNAATTSLSTTQAATALNGTSQEISNQVKFWNWYTQQHPSYNPTTPSVSAIPERPILYQQLTKNKDFQQNTENVVVKQEYEKPVKVNSSSSKTRSVLDNLLLNNNSIQYENSLSSKEHSSNISQREALCHGEILLKYLEGCSDPSVTTLQILTLQTLIKNLRYDVDRKNGDLQNKAKVKRK